MAKFTKGVGLISAYIFMFLLSGQTATAQAVTEKNKATDPKLDAQQYMEIWNSAIKELQMHYVDSIDFKKIMTVGLDAMLSELDPYTEFYSEEDQSEFKTMTTGEYGGIGAVIMQRGDTICISDPYENQPAQEMGLKPGDAILSIDGESMIKKTNAQVSDKLRGVPGTTFELKILRPYEAEPRIVNVTRRKIAIPVVPYAGWLNDSIAYVSLSSFTDKAAPEIQSAIMALRKERPLKGLVFDLRNNPGGLLDHAVKIVNLFVPKGLTVVETKAKLEQWNETFKTENDPIDTEVRIAVLISRGSASAAEILSGSFQDMDRAVIMGERSYGKGLVQNTRPLKYNTLLKLTSAKYYIPSGRCIQAIDYSHRNEDGSVGRIPDSLSHVFYTRNGREVRDGGGIKPDIECTPQTISNLGFYLENGNYIFDYANYYQTKHTSIGNVHSFSISEADYTEFCKMLKDRKFTYDRASGKKLKELREVAKIEGYEKEVTHLLDSLDAKLGHNLDHDLETFKNEIMALINREIAQRYYFQKGNIIQSLQSDSLVINSTALLADPVRYDKILNPKKEALSNDKGFGKKSNAAKVSTNKKKVKN